MNDNDTDRGRPAKSGSRSPGVEAGGPTKPKQMRFSREETRNRILDAAEELFSRRDPSKVTVREIAEAAGVTHPLVHQYVGSKSAIHDAVIERGAPHRQQMISDHPVYREVMPELFANVLDHKVHTRSVVRSAMDGVEYAPFDDRLKTGQMLLALGNAALEQDDERLPALDAVDPRFVLAATLAFTYGWVATEDWLIPIFNLQDESPETIRAQMTTILQHITELVFPLGKESDADNA